MKKTRVEKGITLIALIITIIVLLILAVVTIGNVKKNNIITYAQNAATDYNKEKDKEESLLAGYEALIEQNINKQGGNDMPIAKINTIVDKNSTINGKDYSSDNPIIPAGFKAVNVTTQGHESYWDAAGGPQVLKGLVISDGNSEFVWIPVPDMSKFAKLQDGSTENYRGVLYNWDESDGGDSEGNATYEWTAGATGKYREPANVSTFDSKDKMDIWTPTLYQESFNAMVKSVAKYGGFYIGRYETSMNGSVSQSVPGVTPSTLTWYKMYTNSLTYAASNEKLGVVSEMMWSCQYDAMLKFILRGSNANNINSIGNVRHDLDDPYLTGGKGYPDTYTDISSNIYDLEGNVYERTQAAYSSLGRGRYGGIHSFDERFENTRSYDMPNQSTSNGSRLTLYVKD